MTTPAWTPEVLRDVLAITYGPNTTHSGPDVAAVAAELGVTRRTVQRWIQPNRASGIAPRHLTRILDAARPSDEVRRDEAAKRRYAADAAARIDLPRGGGHVDMWRQQGWLEPHMVTILDIPTHPLRRAVITRADTKALRRLPRSRIIDHALYRHRFDAVLARADILDHVDAWRITAPADVTGRTETWHTHAPLPPLPTSHI